jgi:hypothetical protein
MKRESEYGMRLVSDISCERSIMNDVESHEQSVLIKLEKFMNELRDVWNIQNNTR